MTTRPVDAVVPVSPLGPGRKLPARARIELLLDPGSFQELETLREPSWAIVRSAAGDAVVAGWGTVTGRPVYVFGQDPTAVGGSLGEAGGAKIQRVIDLALTAGAPLVGMYDGGGARIQEGVSALCGFGGIFVRNTRASGVIPQLSLIMGAAAGGASYSPALTDFVIMAEGAGSMAITGPRVIKQVCRADVTLEELGGAWVHTTRSGVAQFLGNDDRACLDLARRLLGFLPQNHRGRPPMHAPRPPSPSAAAPSDAHALVAGVVDGGELLTYAAGWARNVLCGLARVEGRPVGWIANNPRVTAGRLDRSACEKAARFLRTCDAFNLPVVTIVDCPGFATGPATEPGGLLRAAATLAAARAEATVPLLTVVTGRVDRDVLLAMGVTRTQSHLRLAWPGADVAAGSPLDPDRPGWHGAAVRGLIDEVIEPSGTRAALHRALVAMERTGEVSLPARKHENMPL